MAVVSLALPAAAVFLASTNRGLRIFGFTLAPEQAAIFFWVLAIVTAFGAALVFWLIFRTLRGPHFLVLGRAEAVLPKASIRVNMMTVPYSAIQSMAVVQIPGGKMAIVHTSQGEARVGAFGFKSEKDFEKFVLALQQRLDGR